MIVDNFKYEADSILDGLASRYPHLASCKNEISDAIELLVECYRSGGKLLVCGNGGSAADSEHIVGELMKSFMRPREVDEDFAQAYFERFSVAPPAWLEGALPSLSLVSQTALLTAFSNDECAEGYFAQQVYGYGRPGDILWCISTSGNSENVVEAAKVALAKGMKVIALTGQKESLLSLLATISIKVPAQETSEVQELHLPIYHCICATVEAVLFGRGA